MPTPLSPVAVPLSFMPPDAAIAAAALPPSPRPDVAAAAPAAPAWMRRVLLAAAAWHLLWAVFVVCFPAAIWGWFDMEAPRYPQLWQGIGAGVGVLGLGLAIAALDPLRHWPIVLVCLLAKSLGIVGFLDAALRGDFPWAFGWLLLPNDLAWLLPFALILRRAATHALDEPDRPRLPVGAAMERSYTQDGATLAEATFEAPTLLVFVRHFGCTFCREALADLAAKRAAVEALGVRIGIVHMGSDDAARAMFARYGLDDLLRVADPDRLLYRAFDLRRGRLGQLFGPKVWWRGWRAGVLAGHGIGKLAGDGFQMPGVFLLHRGEVVHSFRHLSAADRLDVHLFVACALSPDESKAA